MYKGLVSVVIPSYNREKTIKRAIISVLNQSYSNLEVIVVDDCSMDNTRLVVEEIEDPRVRYYVLPQNSGACAARNYGVEKANGKIIAFQDSDDLWHNDKLEKQLSFMIDNEFEFVTCGFNKISENKTIQMGLKEGTYTQLEVYSNLLARNWISTQTIVCYKYCFQKIHFDIKLKRFQDWDLALQACKFFRMGFLNECLVDVFMQPDSITNTVKAGEARVCIISKQFEYVDNLNNSKIFADYYYAFAGAIRRKNLKDATRNYFISFKYDRKFKTLLLCFLCLTGAIRIYDDWKYRA